MAAAPQNLYIEQGTTFIRTVSLTDGAEPTPNPIDLTGYTVRAQIRQTAQAATALATFTCTLSATPTDGTFTISLTEAQTLALPAKGSDYSKLSRFVWDLEIEAAGGDVIRIFNGFVDVSPEATK